MKTPDEIKKALEICSNGGLWDCDACPYGDSDDCWECRSDLYEDAAAYIHQLENQLADAGKKVDQLEAAQPKWISVEERLPDEPGEVLACVYGRICIAWYPNRCFETPSGMVFYACENAVTHWMPLPQLPKE